MGFIETSYGGKPNLSDVNIDSILNMGDYGITASGYLNILNTMNLNNNDLIGVKRLMCSDFFKALKTTASDNQKKEFIEDNFYLSQLSATIYWNKCIRIPSNIISNSTIRIKFYSVAGGFDTAFTIYRYDPITQTKTFVVQSLYSSASSQWESFNITVSGGELYTIGMWSSTSYSTYCDFQQGIKICYDEGEVVDTIWEVIDE